jgi:AP-3 complex subunit beta
LSSKSLVLVTIMTLENEQVNISVNCEKMVIGSMLLNEIKSHLRN